MTFIFFFSSRRRHTRWTGDWSSDVCSSDLVCPSQALFFGTREQIEQLRPLSAPVNTFQFGGQTITTQVQMMVPRTLVARAPHVDVVAAMERSEERRVGKEGRCRWSAEQ